MCPLGAKTAFKRWQKKRVNASRSFLKRFNDEGEGFSLDKIITTDETWLHFYDPETKQQSSMWTLKGNPPPKKAKVCKSSGKNMCIMFMDRKGILLSHFVPDKLYYMIYKNHNHKTLISTFLSSLNIFGKKIV